MYSWQGQGHSVQAVGKKTCFGWQQDEQAREQRQASKVFSQVWKHRMSTFLASMVELWLLKDGRRIGDPV